MKAWLLLFLLALPRLAYAGSKHVVVVLLPGTSLMQWRTANAPTLHRLMAGGALAVMNTRTARLPSGHARETPESALLTLNAGSRAAAPSGAKWPVLVSDNQRLGYDVRLGNLTDALSAAGVGVYAGGGPGAALLTSTGSGQSVPAPTASVPGLTVWDAGPDPAGADRVLAHFAADTQINGGKLVVLSPSASDADYRAGRRLTPVLVWGPGISAGLLYSPSTHRAGLVTNTDFAPSVAAEFGVTRDRFPSRPFGQAWTPEAAPNAVETVADLNAEAVRQAHSLAILPYVALVLALAVALGAVLARRKQFSALWPLGLAALLAALLLAATPTQSFIFFVLLILVWLQARRFGAQAALLTLFGIIAAALCLDMLTGSSLMHRSLLGYSAIEGARYYGIGNEAMGLLIGSLLVLASRLWTGSKARQGAILGGLGLICLLLGAPSAGAKAGGVLVSVLAFGMLLLMLRGGKWSARTTLGLGLGAAAVLAGAVGLDLLLSHGHGQSHLGEAARRVGTGGWGEARSIILRKLAVETRLAWHSAWAAPLWIGLASVVFTRQSKTADRALRVAGLTAVGACVALNDAGVVAGALCVLPVWCGLVTGPADSKKPSVR